MTMLERYWPLLDEIDHCIKAEAESASEAVLFAVHQPMPLAVRNVGSSVERPATERDFLDSFLTPSLPEGTLLQVVTGASGAGKSHIIRWLAAQLERDPRAERMHIIRIPKSANLRTVIEKILEPLAGDERLDKARTELGQAVGEVTPEIGAIRLVGGLEIALKELEANLKAQLRANPEDQVRRELKVRLDHAKRLPAFFNDAALQDHFKFTVLARIVDRTVRGHDESREDAQLPQFTADDLRVPPELVDLGQASHKVRLYYETVLNHADGSGFKQAADVLNQVLDQSIREVFRLGQAMGGMTLEEIILHIRQILFEDGRELVLLVEDFAALSGIQEILLRVCIQEAVRDGKLVRAPMRTALAVTDGYDLANRDTILTRAKREWIVKTILDTDEDVIAGTRAIVAAYLNAARWGGKELERQFHAGDLDSELTTWITTFNDENLSVDEASVLDVFGKGPRDVSLFPYNDAAIRSLAALHLSEGGRLRFVPRYIINLILRDILRGRRHDFERGQFPPPAFEGAQPKHEIAAWLARTASTPEIRERVASLLAHWGGNPESVVDVAALPTGLFDAFGLPTPQELGTVPALDLSPLSRNAQTLRPKAEPPPNPTLSPKPTQLDDSKIAVWERRLEAWVAGERLTQTHALVLRNEIKNLLLKSINWNAFRLKTTLAPSSLFVGIPNTGGNDKKLPWRVEIADDYQDPDGRLRGSLMALVRFSLNKNDWSYDGGDEDSAIAANFIDGLADGLAVDVEARATEEAASLADLLLKQARVLGIPMRSKRSPASLALSVREVPPECTGSQLPEGSAEARWQELQQESLEYRPGLQDMLVARLGCFQGTGNTAYALDTVRLSEAVRKDSRRNPRDLESGPISNHAKNLSDGRLKVRVTLVAQNLRNFADKMREAFGEPFDKDAYIAEAKEFLEIVEGAGVWPREVVRTKGMNLAIDEFRNTALMDLLNRIRRLDKTDGQEPTLEATLETISRVDFSVVARVQNFVRDMTAFLNAVDQIVRSKEKTIHGADPEAKAEELDARLRTIGKDLDKLIRPGAVKA